MGRNGSNKSQVHGPIMKFRSFPIQRFAFASFLAACAWLLFPTAVFSADRPNILWITCEDINPQLGCFGDTYADTPNLDRFATRGLRYRHCWSTAPVCAPARTTLISGVYPTSTGSEHMRSEVTMPAWMRMYPQLLRERGYYCSNNSKEDYNLTQRGQVWDESSRQAHWRNRKPGQPFFAVFNLEVSHESQIRIRPHTLKHDPAKAPLPAYHPDTPEVRHDWAQYYDEGKLKPPQTFFWERKPPEELYDLQTDRDEVKNLVNSPEHQPMLNELRRAQREHALKIRDVGFLTEAEQHRRSTSTTMYEMGHDPQQYPLEKILAMADLASLLKSEALPQLQSGMNDSDSAVRYWAVLGILMRGTQAVDTVRDPLRAALNDTSPSVRIAAAQALGQYGNDADLSLALPVLKKLAPPDRNGAYVSMLALNAIDALGQKAAPLLETIKTMPTKDPSAVARANSYVARLVQNITGSNSEQKPAPKKRPNRKKQ